MDRIRYIWIYCIILLYQFVLTKGDLASGFIHDGRTTYCWATAQSIVDSKLSPQNQVGGRGQGRQCGIEILITTSSNEVNTFDKISITWSVVADFNFGNILNHTVPYVARESTTNQFYQIVHSNLHVCKFGTNCDPYEEGRKSLDPTSNQLANFTNNRATFREEIALPTADIYSVLAHIVLPGEDQNSLRYDYASYFELVVRDNGDSGDSGDSNSSSTTGVVIGVVLGILFLAVVVVGIILYRRRRKNTEVGEIQTPRDYYPPSTNYVSEVPQWEAFQDSNHCFPTTIRIDGGNTVVSLEGSESFPQKKGIPSAPITRLPIRTQEARPIVLTSTQDQINRPNNIPLSSVNSQSTNRTYSYASQGIDTDEEVEI